MSRPLLCAVALALIVAAPGALQAQRIDLRADQTTLAPNGRTRLSVRAFLLGMQPTDVTRSAKFSTSCGTVDANGVFHAPNSPAAQCTITATWTGPDGRTVSGQVKVDVVAQAPPPPPPPDPDAAKRSITNAEELRLAAITPSDLESDTVRHENWVEVPVHYATRRNVRGGDDREKYFGDEDEGKVRYGVASVSIPDAYRPGHDDTRGLCRYFGPLRCQRSPSNSVMIAGLDTAGEDAWVKGVRDALENDTVGALVYVHGYNNSFKDAVVRTAKLAYGIGFPGVALTFDWASHNTLPGYAQDQQAALRAVPDFKRFLRQVASVTGKGKIVIVAHSMGTSLVSYALKDLATEPPAMHFGPIIFAAADIDSAIFVDQLAASVAASGFPVTLYASSNDRVIRASANVVNAARRVGSGPPAVILRDGIDYVDASSTDTDLLGHGYFVQNKEMIDDIFLAIRYGFPARLRNLRSVPYHGAVYYRLR